MKKYLALGLAALLAIGATIVPDSYDKLFCRMNGTTTTFVDSSTANPKTITANGNATQLPIKFNKSAGFFNGTTDCVVVPASSDFAFGTDAFTIETFINIRSAGNYVIIEKRNIDTSSTGFAIQYASNHLDVYSAGGARITGTTALSLNTWYHIALVTTGGATRTIKLYLNGVQEGGDWTSNQNFTDQTLLLGKNVSSAQYYPGWMKELRISKVARTVAVPTAQYQTDSDTVLLMHFDTPATSPLGPAIAFDGTGDYLSIDDHADWNFASGDFTFEAWINTNNASTAQKLFAQQESSGYAPITFSLADLSAGKLYISTSHTGSSWDIQASAATTLLSNRWYHVAAVRNGATLKIYLNGVEDYSTAISTALYDGTLPMNVGGGYNGGGSFNGSMREIRISNVARYTAPFTPSQNGWTVDSNTKLYIKGDENNGVTTFVDSETSPKTVTTNGDTKIKYTEDYRSCIFKDETGKFPYPVGSAKVDFFAIGSGVGYFDGTGDYLSIPTSTDFDFSNGALTMEFYARHSSVADTTQGYLMKLANGGTTGWTLTWNGAGVLAMYANKTDAIVSSGTYLPLINTWMHVAVSRTSDTWNLFVNGSIIATATNSITISDDTNSLFVGHGATYSGANVWAYDASTYQMNGLLDNVRISKGVARYTTTFNPPDDYSAPRIGKRKTNWFFFF